MTAKEAHRIVRKVCLPDERITVACVDFGEFFGFTFIDKEGDWCSAFRIVNKSTGETGIFNPTQDIELFRKGKDIPLEEVLD